MIELINVTKKYNGRAVVKNISLTFPRYGLIVINGPSGCGKTTLFNILSGLVDFQGDVKLDGKSYQNMTKNDKEMLRNKKLGFVYQDYKLFEFENVKDNILLSINLSSVDTEKKKLKRVQDLLNLVGLAKKETAKVTSLSGGEKQRVAIARALANSPNILLCDEPTGNLDEMNSTRIMELLKKVSSSSLVIVVSHDEILTQKYADEIIKMSDGEIVDILYQNKAKHNSYLPVIKLKYNDKKRTLPFKFLFDHTINSIKRRKWRTIFITISTSFGLLGVGLATSLRDVISSNLYRNYSSILDTDKIFITPKNPNIDKDYIFSASYEEVMDLKTSTKGVSNLGVYYWNIDNLFATQDYLYLDKGNNKNQFGLYNASLINEFGLLKDSNKEFYPNNPIEIEDNDFVLAMPITDINELCFQLQITRSINTLSNYLLSNDLYFTFVFTNLNWNYSIEIPLRLRAFCLSDRPLIFHSNPLWNEYIFEDVCLLSSTEKINVNSSRPWDLKKTYYLNFVNDRDTFLSQYRFSEIDNTLDFELLDKKYYPNLYKNEHSYNCNRLAVIHRSNKDDIPSFLGKYFKSISPYTHKITYGSNYGYSIYEENLMMGFSRLSFLTYKEEEAYEISEKMSFVKYEDAFNYNVPSTIIEGHFSKSFSNGLVFEPRYSLITGREPANFQEIVVSSSLIKRLNITNPLNSVIYFSFPTSEILLPTGYLSREYEIVGLKIVGISDSNKYALSHKEEWSILFFQSMLGISTFDLRINSLAIQIEEGKEDVVIEKINRAFPHLHISAPLKEIKNSIDKVCTYIEIIMLAVSISSVIIASLILIICNYLHFIETKKDIGLVRCLGVKEKESRKFVYAHSFLMTFLSFLFASIELVLILLFLSKSLSSTLEIENIYVFNPISLLYMFLLSLFISLISSLIISTKISRLDPLECLR